MTTPVDSLVEIVKQHKTIKIDKLCSQLGLPSSIVEKWLVILEEYGVLTVNYSGFEGYITYNESQDKKETDIENIKTVFIERCKEKGLTFSQIKPLWFSFLEKTKPRIKEEFIESNKKKGYQSSKIQNAWKKFEKDLEAF